MAQGWRTKASEEPTNPPAPSQVFFCRISCQISVRNLYRGRGYPWPAPNSSTFCLHSAASAPSWRSIFRFQDGSRKYPQKDFQNTFKMIPQIVKHVFFCNLSAISFSTTLGSNSKLENYSILLSKSRFRICFCNRFGTAAF